MLRADVPGDRTGRAVALVAIVLVVAVVCGAIIVSTRYVLCPAPGGTAVYKMDRITGKVWVLLGDQLQLLQEQPKSRAPAGETAAPASPETRKAQLIRWVEQAVHFETKYEPTLASTVYAMDLLGWEVYRLQQGELVACTTGRALDAATDRCVVGYTVRIAHPHRGKLECGWYWEASPQDGLILPINGNDLLESRYCLEDRTDPAVLALLGAQPRRQAQPEPSQAPEMDATERAKFFPYVAHKQRANFHRRICPWAKKIPPEGLLEFKTIQEAKATGRRPCAVCRPR